MQFGEAPLAPISIDVVAHVSSNAGNYLSFADMDMFGASKDCMALPR